MRTVDSATSNKRILLPIILHLSIGKKRFISNGKKIIMDMDNAHIFSQTDVISYLERKGLSLDTIKRLQVYNNQNQNQTQNETQQQPIKYVVSDSIITYVI